jgi:hypothetical protein
MHSTKMDERELGDLQKWTRCGLCSVRRHGDRWGFNIQTPHHLPLVSLTYEAEAVAKEALSLMTQVIEGAMVAIHAADGKKG